MKAKFPFLRLAIAMAFILFYFLLKGQNAPLTNAGSVNSCLNQQLSIPITVTNFNQITALSLRLDFNPTMIDFTGYTNLNSSLNGCLINVVAVSSTLKKVLIIWSNINPLTLENGSKLVDLQFILLSGSPVITFNNISNGGGDCEYANADGNPLNDIPTSDYYIDALITNTGPVANAGIDQTIPYGSNTLLTGSAAGGSEPYSWHWEPANLLVDPDIQNPTTINLYNSATFNLTVTEADGCLDDDDVNIVIEGGSLSIVATAIPDTMCPGDEVQLMALAGGGTGNYSYFWTSNPPGFSDTIQNPIVYPTITTLYIVTVNDGNMIASDDVTVTVENTTDITEMEAPVIIIYPNPNDGHFHILSSLNIIKLIISDVNGQTIDVIFHPAANNTFYYKLSPGVYLIQIFTKNGIYLSKIFVNST